MIKFLKQFKFTRLMGAWKKARTLDAETPFAGLADCLAAGMVRMDPDTGQWSAIRGPLGMPYFVTGLKFDSSNAIDFITNYTLLKKALTNSNNIFVVGTGRGGLTIPYTLEIPTNTTITFIGAHLKRPSGSLNFHLTRNMSAAGAAYVNGVTISNGQITVSQPGHPYNVGDVIYQEGWLTNTSLNGPQTITSVVPGVSWSIAASGSNPTNSATQLVFTYRYNPVAGANFTRASNVVTVSEASHRRGVGDRVYIGALSGASNFNGVAEITSVVRGVSWTYNNIGANETATGTAHLCGDRLINVQIELDGNTDNTSGGSQWHNHLSMWHNMSKGQFQITDSRFGASGRVAFFTNVTDIDIPYAMSSEGVAVLAQFDSGCDRCTVGNIVGNGQADDVLAWGVTLNTGAYGDTASPVGPMNMGELTVHSINGSSPTGLFKMYATASYDAGTVKIGRISGNGPIVIGDPTTGVSGGTLTSLTIEEADNVPANTNAQVVLGSNAWASMGKVRVNNVFDNCLMNPTLTAATASPCVSVYGAADKITIDNYSSKVQRSGSSHILHNSTAPIHVHKPMGDFGNASFGLLEITGQTAVSAMVTGVYHNGSNGQVSFLVYFTAGGWANKITLDQLDLTNLGSLVFVGSGITGKTTAVLLSNCHMSAVSSGFNDGGRQNTFTILADNVNATSLGNNFLQFSGLGTVVKFKGRNVNLPAGKSVLTGNSTQISIDCKEMGVDIGANGAITPTGITPAPGDMLTNTDATGPGVYGYTAAGAWAKIC